jgi:hypothetical protein
VLCRCIVDAIASHRDYVSFGLELLYLISFLLRENFSDNVIDSIFLLQRLPSSHCRL